MKFLLPILILFVFTRTNGQYKNTIVETYKLYSQNEEYFLKIIPFISGMDEDYGETTVYRTKDSMPIYTINRQFKFSDFSDYIHLSNDGQSILYINEFDIDSNGFVGLKYYHNGQLVKEYSARELNNCNPDIEDCKFLYHKWVLLDFDKMHKTFPVVRVLDGLDNRLKSYFKEGASEEDIFLHSYYAFTNNDTTYLVTSRKKLIIFDLKNGTIIDSMDFQSMYNALKTKARLFKAEINMIDVPLSLDDLLLSDSSDLESKIAQTLDMKVMEDGAYEKYRKYMVYIKGFIDQNGNFELIELYTEKKQSEEKLKEVINSLKFQSPRLNPKIKKWYNSWLFDFRNKSNSIAKAELIELNKKEEAERQRRYTLDSIDGVYIPKDLNECFIQLDSLLPTKGKVMVDSMKAPYETGILHFSTGLWIRNIWGLWGGSRLFLYLEKSGVPPSPDTMSSYILDQYFNHRHKLPIESYKTQMMNLKYKTGKLRLGKHKKVK